MNEEKINQILKNQQIILSSLSKLVKEESKTILMEALNEVYWETIHLLNPKEQELTSEEIKEKTPVEEQTEETLEESKDKFGKRKQ